MKIKIAPSILSADFGKLNEEIASIEPYCNLIHVDVMDGHFVPNITIGAPVVKCIKTKLPLDVHLMIENPEKFVPDFVEAGAAMITVHCEASGEKLKETLEMIKSYGVKCGVSVKPKTSLEAILPVIDMLDLVLIMTVEPGFGGQAFMEDMLVKVRELRKLKPELDISVDGGINDETSKLAVEAGANILVAGSYVFKAEDREKAIEALL